VAAEGPFLLDTSAILTFIEDEEGADRVEEVLRAGNFYLPFVALLETHYITLQEKGQAEADARYALLKQLSGTILWEMDEPTLLRAARFKAYHRLSLADAMIAAWAAQTGSVLLHKDPEYDALGQEVAVERLSYQGA
jgi:predicted nucleic acid-binding protein